MAFNLSALDVFIEYTFELGHHGFLGIEVKYVENLTDQVASHKVRFEEVSDESGVVDMSKLDE